MDKNINEPIDVNDDITPISHKPVQRVNATKWDKMSIDELVEQKTILMNRKMNALEVGHLQIAEQIENFGIIPITQLINKKGGDSIFLV